MPEDGTLDLVIRQVRKADGSLGLGSGWLTDSLPLDAPLSLRIRRNPAFHGQGSHRPMILIGNGTGLAGLRAHLRERELAGAGRNWLLFGERTRTHDVLFPEELDRWQASGHVEMLDRVFSRDGDAHRYVQVRLRDRGQQLRDWVQAGAAVSVCGSAEGMAPAVHQVLLDLLGEQRVEQMLDDGLYRRDIY